MAVSYEVPGIPPGTLSVLSEASFADQVVAAQSRRSPQLLARRVAVGYDFTAAMGDRLCVVRASYLGQYSDCPVAIVPLPDRNRVDASQEEQR